MLKYLVTLGGKRYEVEVEESPAVLEGVTVVEAAATPASAAPSPAPAPASAPAQTSPAQTPAGGVAVKAPMPGVILSVKTQPGKEVKAGEVRLVLEAMKMETEIVAPAAGVVAQILVQEGGKVNTDDTLVVLK